MARSHRLLLSRVLTRFGSLVLSMSHGSIVDFVTVEFVGSIRVDGTVLCCVSLLHLGAVSINGSLRWVVTVHGNGSLMLGVSVWINGSIFR